MADGKRAQHQTRKKPHPAGREFLAGGGEIGELMRSIDWSATSIGAAETWPPALQTAISICLNSRYPMFIAWGPEYTFFYNGAYRPILGTTKHPQFIGGRMEDCWSDVWPVVGPLMDSARIRHEATWSENLLLVMTRNGYAEEAYFTFSYSPVRDETGEGGVFCEVAETTGQILAERRLRTLRMMTSNAKTVEEAGAVTAQILAGNPLDIPFALVYLLDDAEREARLAGATGVAPGTAASPQVVDLGQNGEDVWPLTRVARTGQAEMVELWGRFGELPPGP
jgi:hypothetical protein